MLNVALVLFVLQRFHSPTLAGIVVFVLIVPGLLVSPIAGALLDRYGRIRLMLVDYTVAAL
jgi:MFS family permease